MRRSSKHAAPADCSPEFRAPFTTGNVSLLFPRLERCNCGPSRSSLWQLVGQKTPGNDVAAWVIHGNRTRRSEVNDIACFAASLQKLLPPPTPYLSSPANTELLDSSTSDNTSLANPWLASCRTIRRVHVVS